MNFLFSPGWFPSCEREEALQIAKVRLFEKYEFNKEGGMMYGLASRKGTYRDQLASIHRYCIRNITRWREWAWCTGCQNVSWKTFDGFHVANKIAGNLLLNITEEDWKIFVDSPFVDRSFLITIYQKNKVRISWLRKKCDIY